MDLGQDEHPVDKGFNYQTNIEFYLIFNSHESNRECLINLYIFMVEHSGQTLTVFRWGLLRKTPVFSEESDQSQQGKFLKRI